MPKPQPIVCIYLIAAVAMAATIFAVDLAAPLGFAGGVLYVVPILLLSLSSAWRWSVPALSAVAVILTAAAFALSPGTKVSFSDAAFANRLIAIVVILASALLVYWRNSKLSQSVAAEKATRKLAKQLEDSEKRFRDIVDSAGDWIWETDRDLRFTFLSKRFFETTGFTESEFLGKTRADLAQSSPDRIALDAHFDELKHRRPFRDFTYRLPHKDGALRRVSITGKPIFNSDGSFAGYRGTGRDITEQDLAFAERDRALEELHTLFDYAPDGTVVIGSDGRIVRANQQTLRIFDYEREELIGQPVEILLPERFRARHREHRDGYFKAPSRRSMGQGLDLLGRAKDGREFPVDIHLSPLGRGEDALIYASVRDVSSTKRTREQLMRAQRLDALGKLTGGIAHDFNNLLSTMMGGLQLAERRIGKDHPAQKYIETCLRAAHNGSDLTKRLMTFAKQQPLAAKPLLIDDLLSEVRPLIHQALDDRIEFNIHAQDKDRQSIVTCDRSQCVGAILNLILNARDALTTDWEFSGHVTLGLRRVVLDGASAAQVSLPAGRYVEIAVTDNGPGMPPRVVEQAMEPFFTTKGPEQGTGLGLSMVYGFAKQTNGAVQIYSELGSGTTVSIYLPETDADAVSFDGTSFRNRHKEGNGACILVVEDQPELLETTTATVSDLGYLPIPVASGKEAVDILIGDTEIDLIFSDFIMPGGMTGLHLAEVAKTLRPDLKIVLTTGFGGETLDEASKQQVRILQKPYSRELLADALASELEI